MDIRKIRTKLPVLLLVTVLIAALVVTACGDGNGGNGNPRPWVLHYGYPTTGIGNADGIDPAVNLALIGIQTAEVLFVADPETHEPLPFIGTNISWSENQSYADIWLRDDVKFHNGDHMTAEDVKFSYDSIIWPEDRFGDPANPLWQRFFDHIEVIDTYHVRVHMKDVEMPPREDIALQPIIVPKDYIEEVGWEVWAQAPVLTGPMKITDWQADVYCHLEKAFPEEGHWYWGDLPNYDELRIWSVVEPSTRLAMLKAGELDIAQVPPAMVNEVEDDPDLTLVMSEYCSAWNVIFYDWANNDSPLSDPDVRRAVSLAIDRESIGTAVTQGTHVPYGSYYAPYGFGYEERAPDPYNLVEAQSLLTTAGYPEGFDTYFVYPQDKETVSAAIIASLNGAGIRAQAQPYEPTTWATMLATDEHVGMGYMHIPAWYGRYYAEDIVGDEVWAWGAQVSRDIPEVEAAWDALVTADDEVEYLAAAQAVQPLIYDELGYKIPVFAEHFAFGYGTDIEEWVPWPGTNQQSLMEVTYKE
jgi:peptide/nickel transport system substrate-binding protein